MNLTPVKIFATKDKKLANKSNSDTLFRKYSIYWVLSLLKVK